MPTFAYRARDMHGAPVEGQIEARSQGDALRLLDREGKTVTDIRVGAKAIDPAEARARQASGGVKRDEIISFSSQLAVMLETGVPLAEALDAFVKSANVGGLRRVMQIVAERIHAGVPFSAAMLEFPRVFPGLMVSLMQASEASGRMGEMLGRISEYLAKERRTARQIRGALTYPAVMIAIAVVVTTFLVTWVLPKFAKIYESREAALPTITKVVIGSSRVLIEHWPWFVGGLGAMVAGFLVMRGTAGGRRALDMFKLRAPVVGPMFRAFYLTRACRTLGTLLASGVPLLEAVRIVRGVTENSQWERLWLDLEASLTTGKTVAEVVSASWLIPPQVAQMIAAGERSGRLPEVLDRIGVSTEADLDEAVKSATQLIEPAMIIFMGGTIGGIAIALLLPIFNVANVMAH
ncbi:MAG: type II secretion system F family protein [Planctomycetota bacterium]|nr:type II secretion system F family protein [Planctomycetota bacterium]